MRSLLIFGLALALPLTAAAADNEKSSRTYRWVDNKGVVHYGDSIPPEFAHATSPPCG